MSLPSRLIILKPIFFDQINWEQNDKLKHFWKQGSWHVLHTIGKLLLLRYKKIEQTFTPSSKSSSTIEPLGLIDLRCKTPVVWASLATMTCQTRPYRLSQGDFSTKTLLLNHKEVWPDPHTQADKGFP